MLAAKLLDCLYFHAHIITFLSKAKFLLHH